MALDNSELLLRKLAMEVLEEASVQDSRRQTKLVQHQVAWVAREEDLGHRLKASSRTQLLLRVVVLEALVPQVANLEASVPRVAASEHQVASQGASEHQAASQAALEPRVVDSMPPQVWEVASVHLPRLRSQLLQALKAYSEECDRLLQLSCNSRFHLKLDHLTNKWQEAPDRAQFVKNGNLNKLTMSKISHLPISLDQHKPKLAVKEEASDRTCG